MVYTYFHDLSIGCVRFTEYDLGDAVRQPDWAANWIRQLIGDDMTMSYCLYTPIGVVHADDVVWLAEPYRLAKVRLAIQVGKLDRGYTFYVIVDVFKQKPNGVWSSTVERTMVVHAATLFAVCTHVIIDGAVFV